MRAPGGACATSTRPRAPTSRADDDEIDALAHRRGVEVPALAVAQRVRGVERPGLAALEAAVGRRIALGPACEHLGRREPRDDRDRHAVQEVAPGDAAHDAMVARRDARRALDTIRVEATRGER
jgi:hypothetical protein